MDHSLGKGDSQFSRYRFCGGQTILHQCSQNIPEETISLGGSLSTGQKSGDLFRNEALQHGGSLFDQGRCQQVGQIAGAQESQNDRGQRAKRKDHALAGAQNGEEQDDQDQNNIHDELLKPQGTEKVEYTVHEILLMRGGRDGRSQNRSGWLNRPDA